MNLVRAAAAIMVAVAAAGCSAHANKPAASRTLPATARTAGRSPSAAAVSPAATRGAPGCTTAAASAPALPAVSTSMQAVPGSPVGVVASPVGNWSFVSLADGLVEMFRTRRSGMPSAASQIPGLVQPLGEAVTGDGRYLLVASGQGATVISLQRAEQGSRRAVLGMLASPVGGGPAEVAVSPGDRFAFVSLEDSGQIAVFNLQRALTGGFGPRDFVGTIPTGTAPAGLAVSPGGRWLYATSEVAGGGSASSGEGTLSTISLQQAETDPARSVVSTVRAGCGAVRVITSADGRVVWVTARESDALLGFSAADLVSRPARSLIARVAVGLALVGGGKRMVVADSNRFDADGASSSLAVVNVPAALAGRAALLGYLRAGAFPREMTLEPGGRTLLVTNFDSGQLETVSIPSLP